MNQSVAMMSTCEFYYIRSRDNLPILAKGVEKSWPELQAECQRTGPGYPNATYYKTISDEGPELFAVVNKKWVLYHEGGTWHRYISACDLKFETVLDTSATTGDERKENAWVVVSKNDCGTEPAQQNM